MGKNSFDGSEDSTFSPPAESAEAVALRLAERIADAEPPKKGESQREFWLKLYAECLEAVRHGSAGLQEPAKKA